MNRPARASQVLQAIKDAGGDALYREGGKLLINAIAGCLRNLRLYPVENATVQSSIEELRACGAELRAFEGELEIRLAGEFLFVNSTRLRLDLGNYTNFSLLLSLFRGAGVGQLKLTATPTARDWTVLLGYLLAPQGGSPEAKLEGLLKRLDDTKVECFEVGAPVEASEDQEKSKDAAKRTYTRSVEATREVMQSVRMGQSPSLRKIKRVVQGIVDQIFNDESSLIGLTTIRDYDDYTFTHSVNVCIFSVALGRRLGLSRLQLYDLGMAALFHDIGKSRVPVDVLNKPDVLTDDEWKAIASHPWLGVLGLFQLKEAQEFPYRSMLVAYQHHMKRDLTGYPRTTRTTALTFYSRIVAVADGFDAATSRRSYQSEPMAPAAVLAEMRDNPRRGMDPVIVKAFVNLLGIYPVGTFLVLDTFELAIVQSTNPNPEFVSRPIVRVVSDPMGVVMFPGAVADLAERGADGVFLRSIIKTADPEKYGIRVGDYFL
ncbi:MAG: HD domain-containing protein [Gemmatimonadaceae bacterium]|nr:HD domain-containing protein [Gemmatimonadaceae bacterium]